MDSLVHDLQRRAARKIATIKWREWLLLPSIPLTAAALLINTIVVITYLQNFASHSDDKTGRFSFYDLPDGPVRSKVVAAVSLEAALLVVLWAETLHFLLFFHRDDRVRRRGAIQAGLATALVVFAAVTKVVSDQLTATPFTSAAATAKRPDLTLAQFNAAYGSWLDSVLGESIFIVLIVSVADAAAHFIVVVFWLWLLPARHRLPNRYEPVIGPRKGRRRIIGGNGDHSSYHLIETADVVNVGPLEAVFQEHERTRISSRRNPSVRRLQRASRIGYWTNVPCRTRSSYLLKGHSPHLHHPRALSSILLFATGW